MKMDKQIKSNGHVEPGVSLSNGPVRDEATGAPVKAMTNGLAGKRKASTGISYAQDSDSAEDEVPLVGALQHYDPVSTILLTAT